MAQLLKGAEVVSALNDKIKSDVAALQSRGVTPTLAILRVGEKPDDLAYERGAIKRAETVGVAVKQIVLSETVSQESLLAEIAKINLDATILQGNIDSLQGVPFGNLLVELSGAEHTLESAVAVLEKNQVKVEVIGYVARNYRAAV